ncbi:MAG: pantoate--beta-alanine ligase, partial [Acidimicrobiales bacterium]
YRALQAGGARVKGGEGDAGVVRSAMAAVVAQEPLARLDYAEVADPETLDPLDRIAAGTPARLLVAARIGPARLIDNLGVTCAAA